MTNIATRLFNSNHKPSIHRICQFLDMLTIHFWRSSLFQSSNQLIFNNTSPYQYLTSTLLVSKWSSVPITELQESLSSAHKTFEKPVFRYCISWPSLDVSTYALFLCVLSCSMVVGFQLSLPWLCLWALNALYFWALQVGCTCGIWQHWRIMRSL